MLTGRARRLLILLLAVLFAAAAVPAYADTNPGPGDCGPGNDVCIPGEITGTPGGDGTTSPGGGDSNGGASACTVDGIPYPCHSNHYGDFNPQDQCYWMVMSPPPPPGDAAWAVTGHTPADGGVMYQVYCPAQDAGYVSWQKAPITGPTAAQLAQQVLAMLTLYPPPIQLSPGPGRQGLVNLPTWLWLSPVGPNTWGPVSATATAPGLAVTGTATVDKVVWSMGDGNTVTCTTPGTAYDPSYGDQASPDCGYQYTKISTNLPGGVYSVTATSYWTVNWQATTGETGVFHVTRSSAPLQVSIGEMQVVN